MSSKEDWRFIRGTYFFIFFIGVLSFFTMAYLHEEVHRAIYRDYGIESRIGFEFPHMVTVAEEGCSKDSCKLAHNINEAITYPLQAIFAFMIIASCDIIALLAIILTKVRRLERNGIQKESES